MVLKICGAYMCRPAVMAAGTCVMKWPTQLCETWGSHVGREMPFDREDGRQGNCGGRVGEHPNKGGDDQSPPSSSSMVASKYCWYSAMRSTMLLSASVNSISSMPSPVYQWRNALRLNMGWNWSSMRWKISRMAVLFPMREQPVSASRGLVLQMDCLMLWGIHSAKNGALRLSVMIICSSTSFDGTGPRKMTDAVRYLPLRGSHAAIMFLASNTCSVSSLVVTLR